MELTQELELHQKFDLAFVIGNGVNRYTQGNDRWSWEYILRDAWKQLTGSEISSISGMSLTEMYNLLELRTERCKASALKDKIIEPFKKGVPTSAHKKIQSYLERWNVPVLTTNFDHMLEEGYTRRTLKHPQDSGRYHAKSYYYPWDRYFSNKEIQDSNHDYAVWHINGFVDFPHSIKLSSSEYIAQASHCRGYIHQRSMDDFDKKNLIDWKGCNTWLNPIFNCSLCILGLSLNEDETFLRWLLIERKKYYNKFPDRQHQGWYVYQKDDSFPEGKKIFMQGVGLMPVEVTNYSDIYEDLLKR